MKRSASANLNIGHHGAQEVKAIKANTGGKKPQKKDEDRGDGGDPQ